MNEIDAVVSIVLMPSMSTLCNLAVENTNKPALTYKDTHDLREHGYFVQSY